MNVAIYLRKSRADLELEKNGEFETLAKHRATLIEYAKKNDLNIVEIKYKCLKFCHLLVDFVF